MSKFDLFKQQMNFKEDVLKRAHLFNVEVNIKEKTWILHIELEKMLDIKTLSEFIEQVSMFFKIAELDYCNVQIKLGKYEWQTYALDYFKYSIEELVKVKPSFALFKNYEIQFNQGYQILVDKGSKFIQDYVPDILQKLQTLGYQEDVKIVVNEALKTTKQIINEVVSKQDKILSEQAIASSIKDEVIAVNTFSKRSKASIIPIKEIPITAYDIDKYRHENGRTNFMIFGEIAKLEIRKLTKATLMSFILMDEEDAIVVKQFLGREKDYEFAQTLKDGMFLEVSGNAQFDNFSKEVVIFANTLKVYEKTTKDLRQDKAKEKRVEFHVHTKMSNMDAINDAEEFIKQASLWGHKAIGITDHNAVYAFPDIAKAAKKYNIKPIYGAEMDFVNEQNFFITSQTDADDFKLNEMTYVVFDIETTGLSRTRDRVIEIGATKIKSGQVVDRFQTFVDPQMKISSFITNLTGISDDDLMGAPLIKEALTKFFNYAEGACLVAHNALFDIGHLRARAEECQLEFNFPYVIDTLNFSRYFYQDSLKRFNLKALAKHFNIKQTQHHRADDDAFVTAQIWIMMMHHLQNLKILNYQSINQAIDMSVAHQMSRPMHVNLYVKNQIGYKNLFKIISESLTDNFYQGPRMTLKTLHKHREGIILSSGCYQGEVFEAALNLDEDDLRKAIAFYDVIEVQPPSAYKHLFQDLGENGREIIESMIHNIIKEAKKQDKMIIASGDVHYLNREDHIYRNMYIRAPRVGKGMHDLSRYDVMPDVHFRTTNEMLESFSFLEPSLAYEIVVKNTNILASKIEEIQAFPNSLYSLPDDAFADSLGVASMQVEVEKLVYEQARKMYGESLHPIIKKRIEKELKSIIGNQFAPIYYISHLLVKKSLEDGYLVGSRGSVGSSLVATLLEITEVNPLKPHYRSKDGRFVCFLKSDEDESALTPEQILLQPNFVNVQSGYDLPDALDPLTQTPLIKDGHDIPFETFLGFDGDKVPDIDLNFSGEYQARAHNYVRELLGEDYSFRAGTIQTVAEKNAYGYVKGYLEESQIVARQAQIERLAKKIEGAQRSTGQHPGGIVVVPKNKEIYDVTPIQYPANDTTSTWYTTHFDYHSFEANLLKLDILGHDDPTMIKYLMDYVTAHPDEFSFNRAQDIPLDDKNVYRLFYETSVIGVTADDIKSEVASYGIPEFGTPFTRQMLIDTKPKTFAGLVKISGLSHGTDVWLKNADALVRGDTEFGKVAFDDIIGCRDDIMVQLTNKGLEPKKAFDIMEFVRKGKPSKDIKTWSVFEKEMAKYDVEPWYIWSASQIKYMFPKAHACAYVIMAMRIAWFKVYHPKLFYSAFFSKRAAQFDYEVMVSGVHAIQNAINRIQGLTSYESKVKDEQLSVTLGVALEMAKRGFKFLSVDINLSDALNFTIEKEGLRMPFITVDGLGGSVALDIVEQRQTKVFESLSDVKKRTKINKTVFERLENYGAFKDLNIENDGIDDGLFAL